MKAILAFAAGVYLFASFYQTYAAVDFECFPGGIIQATINKTTDSNLADDYITIARWGLCMLGWITNTDKFASLQGDYVTVQNVTTCNGTDAVQLMDVAGTDLQSANVTCYPYNLTESFIVLIVEDPMVLSQNFMRYNLTCDANDNATAVANINVTVAPTAGNVNGTFDVQSDLITDQSTYALGETVTLTITLQSQYTDDVRLGVDFVIAIAAGQTTEWRLVNDRCPLDVGFTTVTQSGSPSGAVAKTKVDTTFGAFIPFTEGLFSGIVLTFIVGVRYCPVTDTSLCFEAGTCPGPTDKVGRRRRQDNTSDVNIDELRGEVLVFPNAEAKQAYIDGILDDAGLVTVDPVQKDDQVCLNTTVTAVILALILIVMVTCLIATGFLVGKMKMDKKKKLVKYPNNAYPNKAF